jgi:hypothetical protein
MTIEVSIYDPRGAPLDVLNVTPTVSCILNDVGDASFEISLDDPKATEENLTFGNILLIAHDKLPTWIGFIDSIAGRDWHGGSLTIRALSAESIFDSRIVYPERMVATNGAIIKTMLQKLLLDNNVDGGIQVHPGDIFMGGRINIYPYIGRCREIINRVVDRGKMDWSITHEITKGKLILYFNLFDGWRGQKIDKVLDARNTEIANVIYTEQGEIWNHVVFMTPISQTGQIKISKPFRDSESIGRYGLKMYLGEANAEDDWVLEWQAKAWLYDHAYPRGITTPTILDVDDFFSYIDLGNIYRWENHAVGFEGTLIGAGDDVRLTGYEIDYMNDKVGATVESTKRPFDILSLFNE